MRYLTILLTLALSSCSLPGLPQSPPAPKGGELTATFSGVEQGSNADSSPLRASEVGGNYISSSSNDRTYISGSWQESAGWGQHTVKTRSLLLILDGKPEPGKVYSLNKAYSIRYSEGTDGSDPSIVDNELTSRVWQGSGSVTVESVAGSTVKLIAKDIAMSPMAGEIRNHWSAIPNNARGSFTLALSCTVKELKMAIYSKPSIP